ncbi:hypothetical protein JCM7447_09600 [Corynebacterium amycolatum]
MAEIYRAIELGFAVVYGLNRALRKSLAPTPAKLESMRGLWLIGVTRMCYSE